MDEGITGHIDILQVRNGKVYLVDYKPEAAKEKKAPRQLYQYAVGLSFRTGIPFEEMRCVYFDEDVCYRFSPEEVEANLIREE